MYCTTRPCHRQARERKQLAVKSKVVVVLRYDANSKGRMLNFYRGYKILVFHKFIIITRRQWRRQDFS